MGVSSWPLCTPGTGTEMARGQVELQVLGRHPRNPAPGRGNREGKESRQETACRKGGARVRWAEATTGPGPAGGRRGQVRVGAALWDLAPHSAKARGLRGAQAPQEVQAKFGPE